MLIPVPSRQQHVDRIQKKWGYEHVIVNNDKYCCKVLQLMRGKQSSLHYHPKKDELFYIVFGHCTLEYGKRKRKLCEGNFQRLRPGVAHRFSLSRKAGVIGCLIVEVSTKHDDSDVVRIEPSGICSED